MGCCTEAPILPPNQAQACVLLQKALPTRELRLCFEDPEWEQLVSQILVKVTEVRAVDPCRVPAGVVLWDPGLQLELGCLLRALVLSGRLP